MTSVSCFYAVFVDYYAIGISPQRDPIGQPRDVMVGTNAVIGCGEPNNALSADVVNNDYELAQKTQAQVRPLVRLRPQRARKLFAHFACDLFRGRS